MSLYNLIPSCPICNQRKGSKDFSLNLHPYEQNLCDKLTFRIVDKNVLMTPQKTDQMDVVIDTTDSELRRLIGNLELERRYSRHLDLVKELEYAQYLSAYYDSNIGIISNTVKNGLKVRAFDDEILKRHLLGFYDKPDDINKRPLTKFSQDIYAQLKIILGSPASKSGNP